MAQKIDQLQMHMLEKIADLHSVPEGAYNIRSNGALTGRNTTANIDIVSKADKPGHGRPKASRISRLKVEL